MNAQDARNNVKAYEVKREEERLIRVNKYLSEVEKKIEYASQQGCSYCVMTDMDMLSDSYMAETFLKELGFEVARFSDKNYLKISW